MLNSIRTQYYHLNDENIEVAVENKNLLSSEKVESENQSNCEDKA